MWILHSVQGLPPYILSFCRQNHSRQDLLQLSTGFQEGHWSWISPELLELHPSIDPAGTWWHHLFLAYSASSSGLEMDKSFLSAELFHRPSKIVSTNYARTNQYTSHIQYNLIADPRVWTWRVVVSELSSNFHQWMWLLGLHCEEKGTSENSFIWELNVLPGKCHSWSHSSNNRIWLIVESLVVLQLSLYTIKVDQDNFTVGEIDWAIFRVVILNRSSRADQFVIRSFPGSTVCVNCRNELSLRIQTLWWCKWHCSSGLQ